jgi:hypothetical protein
MIDNISKTDLQASIVNINLLYNNYNLIKKENSDLKEQLEKKKIDVSELKAELRERKSKIDLYNKKFSNQQARIDRIEEVYSKIPGTTKDDKHRFLEFCAVKILPEIFKEVKSKQYKMVERHWNLYHESQWIKIKKSVEEEQAVVKMAMYLLYSITNNLKATNLDNIIEDFFTEILLDNIDTSKEILLDWEKVMENKIVKQYRVIEKEVIVEAVEIFNNYSNIIVNNLVKEKREIGNIELYEYNEYMYDITCKADNINHVF